MWKRDEHQRNLTTNLQLGNGRKDFGLRFSDTETPGTVLLPV